MLWLTHRKVERKQTVITGFKPTSVAIIPDGKFRAQMSMGYHVTDKNVVIHEEWVPRGWWKWVRSWMPSTKR